jgi:hypothetical protein
MIRIHQNQININTEDIRTSFRLLLWDLQVFSEAETTGGTYVLRPLKPTYGNNGSPLLESLHRNVAAQAKAHMEKIPGAPREEKTADEEGKGIRQDSAVGLQDGEEVVMDELAARMQQTEADEDKNEVSRSKEDAKENSPFGGLYSEEDTE